MISIKIRLRAIIELHKAVKVGSFKLSSGKISDFYFDGRLLSLDSLGSKLIYKGFKELYKEKINAIGGPASGANSIIGTLLGKGIVKRGFYLRKEAKEHGMKQLFEGHSKEGWKVVIIDDTATTGQSLLECINYVQKEKRMHVVGCFVVMDREEGAKELIRDQAKVELKSIFKKSDFIKAI